MAYAVHTATLESGRKLEGASKGNLINNLRLSEVNGKWPAFIPEVSGGQGYIHVLGAKATATGEFQGAGMLTIVDGAGNVVFHDASAIVSWKVDLANPRQVNEISAKGFESQSGSPYATRSSLTGIGDDTLKLELGRPDDPTFEGFVALSKWFYNK